MPQAASRLALLIQLLDITGYDLATSLNIDPSLISKWKHKRRKIPGRTDVMPKIAGYLLDVDARQGGRTIVPLLNAMSRGNPPGREKAIELLTEWLLDPEPPEWFTGDQKAEKIRLERDSFTCPVEVFQGTTGRRIAVLRFLDSIVNLPSDSTLLLTTQEDLGWIIDDPEFLSEFRLRLQIWTRSGHHLEVIHSMNRHQFQLQALIQHLLPLHLDARINSLYYPLYSELKLPLTVLAVPGHKALIGSCIDPGADQHTVLCTDQATVRQIEALFASVKASCYHLIDYFESEQIPFLLSRFLESRLRSENQIISIQSRLPLLFCLPAEILGQILLENGISGNAQADMIRQWRIFGSFFGEKTAPERITGTRIRIIHHMGAIELILKRSEIEDPFLSALAGRTIQVRRHFFLEYLRFLANAILCSNHVEMALIHTDIYNRSAWPNQMVVSNGFWAAWGMKASQNRLLTQESTMVHAFDCYFQDRWQMIPHIDRDRSKIASWLTDLADYWSQPL